MVDRLDVGVDLNPGADFTLESGQSITLCLKTNTNQQVLSNCTVGIYLKDGTKYYLVDWLGKPATLSESFRMARRLDAPGTYRLARISEGEACGVFSNE